MEDTPHDLPAHIRPNLSCLEVHRSEIALARKRRWPVRVIAAWLLERHGLKIDQRNIARFCKRRGIAKGRGETIHQDAGMHHLDQRTQTLEDAEETVFSFDKSKPIETWKSKSGTKRTKGRR